MRNPDSEKTPLINKSGHHVYKLYTRRWFVLAVVALFNVTNAMIWITFAPVTNFAASYFEISEKSVNYFSLVYFIASLPMGGISWWTIETYGFRFSVILGCIVNALGGVLRVVGAYSFHGHLRFTIVLVAQILSACVQPFVLSMPTKIAALWFGDHERTIANTIATMANPLGVLVANGIAAGIVSKEDDIGLLLIVTGAPAVITALLAIFGIWSSKPPTPPSPSALIEPVSFFVGIKTILKQKKFMLLALTSGMGIAAFSSISTIVQQLICPQGYSDTTAGILGALVIVGGFVGAGLSGYYVDNTRKYIDISKILGILFGFSGSLCLIAVNLRDMVAFNYIAFTLYGLTGLGVLPVFLELGVECTYPVDEATSSGIQWMIGQVIGAILFFIGLEASPKLSAADLADSTCKAEHDIDPLNFSTYAIVVTVLASSIGILFIMFFDTDYKRLQAERELDADITDQEPHPNTEDARNIPNII
eukprot:TCONS_00066934-protein